jgi:virulence factor BrkB
VSPGGVLAVIGWVIASLAFAFYVANFGSYNKTYGALAGPIVFLGWLWISNIMVVLGAEFNAELERGRAIEAGHPEEREPFVEPRDTRKIEKGRKCWPNPAPPAVMCPPAPIAGPTAARPPPFPECDNGEWTTVSGGDSAEGSYPDRS